MNSRALVRNLLAVAALGASLAAAQQNPVVIRAGHLIDPATGKTADNQSIVVQNGKIVSVGNTSGQTPAGAATLDLSREWVMPGLMDAHSHLTFDMETTSQLLEPQLLESSALRALRGLRNAGDVLRAGFTTVRDLGNGANYAVVDLRKAINKSWFPGPTILTTGKIIAPFGGQAQDVPLEQGRLWHFEYEDADTPDELRKAVRRNIFYGADVIKLVADNADYYYSEDEIRAAVTEAHRANRAVAAHVFTDAPAKNVILGGADSIEHGYWLTADVLKPMKEKGTVLVATDPPPAMLAELVARHQFTDAKQMDDLMTGRLKLAYQSGVTLVFGTDTVLQLPGKTRGETMLEFPEVWRRAGVPNAVILKAMTTQAATLLRVQSQRGAIAPGLAADLVAMPGNPLSDINALRRINFVMKDGSVVRQP